MVDFVFGGGGPVVAVGKGASMGADRWQGKENMLFTQV